VRNDAFILLLCAVMRSFSTETRYIEYRLRALLLSSKTDQLVTFGLAVLMHPEVIAHFVLL